MSEQAINTRIGFNLLYAPPDKIGGAETYAFELIPRLAKLLPEASFVAYLTRDTAAVHPSQTLGCEVRAVAARSSSPWQWPVYEQLALPVLARRDGVEVLHSMALCGPVFTPGITHLMTVHDATFMKFKGSLRADWAQTAIASANQRAAVRAARIITVSESSKRDIAEIFGYPSESIDVTPNAGRGAIGRPAELSQVCAGQLVGKRFLLAVGSLLGHKNMPGLLTAFSRIPPEDVDLLVICGFDIRSYEPFRELSQSLGIEDRLLTPGWLEESELSALYDNAACFVHTSFMEGFGLPILEAMERGLPVATSNTTSLPEVGGDAVAYFDPADSEAIARTVTELLRNEPLRVRFAAAGRARAKEFSWDRTAELTVESYKRVLNV